MTNCLCCVVAVSFWRDMSPWGFLHGIRVNCPEYSVIFPTQLPLFLPLQGMLFTIWKVWLNRPWLIDISIPWLRSWIMKTPWEERLKFIFLFHFVLGSHLVKFISWHCILDKQPQSGLDEIYTFFKKKLIETPKLGPQNSCVAGKFHSVCHYGITFQYILVTLNGDVSFSLLLQRTSSLLLTILIHV